ncbi:MAG: acetolactate synthase small subunit [Candidatus Omnitrophica bacterium]|nr:acetolactate synthase small subunit [Candidatus Omnitrophota bacterium]
MKHTISVLVENHFGVLAHVAGLFSSRGFNINSLAVGETEDPSISRMTIVVGGDEHVLEQVMKQLNKLVDVIKVVDMTNQESIDRELVLVKVNVTSSTRMEVMQIVQTFRAKIVDASSNVMTIEVTGTDSKVDAMLELMQPYGIKEVARTGVISMARKSEVVGKKTVTTKSTKKHVQSKKKNK